MYLNFFGTLLFSYTDISFRLKIVYTKTFVVFFSDFCFFFFRVKNIRIVSNLTGLYMLGYNLSVYSCIFKLFRMFLLDSCLGCYCYFFLSGIGFRIILDHTQIFFRLGYSNLILLNVPVGVFFLFVDKLHFGLYSINLNLLMKYCTYLRLLHLNNIYKQRGLYFSDEILNFKILRNKKVFF